jgi:hypothetical protein
VEPRQKQKQTFTIQEESFDDQLNERLEEVTEEERVKLDLTRNRLSAWFPA